MTNFYFNVRLVDYFKTLHTYFFIFLQKLILSKIYRFEISRDATSRFVLYVEMTYLLPLVNFDPFYLSIVILYDKIKYTCLILFHYLTDGLNRCLIFIPRHHHYILRKQCKKFEADSGCFSTRDVLYYVAVDAFGFHQSYSLVHIA